ncbi:hypothetical protein ACS0TY_001410 [Phlomoides rotata]
MQKGRLDQGDVETVSYSLHHIDALVGEDVPWQFTGIYGYPEEDQKWRTWRLLDRLGEGYSGPWLCAGDFNEILDGSEKMGAEARMMAFRDCIEWCGLSDLGYVGNAYTWSNKQAGLGNIQERLNRGLGSEPW